VKTALTLILFAAGLETAEPVPDVLARMISAAEFIRSRGMKLVQFTVC